MSSKNTHTSLLTLLMVGLLFAFFHLTGCSSSDHDSNEQTDNPQPVVLDETFGVDGIALIEIVTPIGGGILRSIAYDIAIQPDGKILAAGCADGGSDRDIVVVRCNADGSLDTSLGENWIVTTPIGSFNDEAKGIAIQSDGKIVVAGYSDNGSDRDIAVVRYNADGSLDTLFGSGGIVTTPVGSFDDEANGIAIQSDEKIVVAGYSDNGSDRDIAVVRYNADGSLDTLFGSGGIVTTPVGSFDDEANGIVIQPDGYIVVAGHAWGQSLGGSTALLTVVRYTDDGSLDTTFDVDGIVTTTMMSTPPSIAMQSDGKIVVAGASLGVKSLNIYLARFTADGSLDATFGSGGVALTPTGGNDGGAQGLAIQEDGKALAAGTFAISKDETFIALARYTVDGSLDTSFDSDGMVIEPSGYYFVNDIALQPDGKIVLGGYTPNDMFLMRYEGPGSKLEL